MIYAKRTWRLPTLTLDKAHSLAHARYLQALTSSSMNEVPDSNPWKCLLDLARHAEPIRAYPATAEQETVKELDRQSMQIIHDTWGHLSNSKMDT